MLELLARIVKHPRERALLDHPVVFSGFRFLIVGFQLGNRRRLRSLLSRQRPQRVLDVCCGPGDFAGLVSTDYYGIDLNPRFVALAQRSHSQAPRKQFHVGDATKMRLPAQSFDTALFINGMHHFPDDQVRAILREIVRVTERHVIVLDLEAERGHWLQRLVMSLDRGDYVRSNATQRQLLEEFLDVEDFQIYPVWLTVQTMFICRPRASEVS